MIGPWNHGGQCNGDLTYPGSDDDFFFIRNGVEWFDHTLRGMDYPHPLGVVEAYQIGGEKYDTFDGDITASTTTAYYLAADATLKTEPKEAGSLSYLYDPTDCPENPWGNVLGNGSDPTYGGPRKQRLPGARSDVITFVSDVLTQDMEIAGAMEAELYVASDAPATAFAITVSEVFENGDAFNIRSDITDIRFLNETVYEDYTAGDIVSLSLKMLDVCWKVKKGSRLRIDISSSEHPAYHIHPNTTDCWGTTTTSQVAHQTIYYGVSHPSCVRLPLK